jgi:hypothetical protein
MQPKDGKKEQTPTNYRKARRSRERTLLVLVIFVLVVIGDGLIGLIWGMRSALLGGLCLLSGAILITGLWLLLNLVERWVGE